MARDEAERALAMMNYTPELRDFVRWWEAPGARPILKPHYDRFGKVQDIGFGHVFRDDEEVRALDDDEEAEDLLTYDLWCVEMAFDRLIQVELEQHEYDACCTFAFNVGTGQKGFGGSQMLAHINAGEFDLAAAEFTDYPPKWTTSGGVVVPVLVRRRRSERRIFEYADYSGRP